MHTITRNQRKLAIVFLMVIALLASGLQSGNASAAPMLAAVQIDLCATTGSVTMPDATVVTIWGYAPGNCSGNPTASLPGPTITVNEGDDVTITLYNNLPEITALLFQGQVMIPDLTGVATGGSKTYTFTASNPGTFLYEAGLLPNAQHQVAMGLYGALIVESATPGQAYGTADSAFDAEVALVLSEIDPSISVNPAGFDMRNYHPKYFLINGKAYPDTDPIPALAGDRVLLRFINAGLQSHSMAILGLSQSIVALDGSPLGHPSRIVAETISPGLTQDSILTVPASAPDGSLFAIYDANLTLRNSRASGMGGMIALLQVGTTPPGGSDITGPATSAVTLTPNQVSGSIAVAVSASVSDVASGGSNIAAAEYYIDSISGTASPMSGAFASPTELVNATIPDSTVGGLSTGNHTIYVRGQDAAGNWGAFNSAILKVDNTGPSTTGLILTPNVSNGTVIVSIRGTADDTASGNNNVTAAEFFIDLTGPDGSGNAMNLNTVAPVASITGSIPAATVLALPGGLHTIAVHSRDSMGNWGAFASVTLTVQKSGPSTSNVQAQPNPTNGQIGYNSSTPAVRITASFTDTTSNVVAAEGFIGTAGANGTGFQFLATDGVFNALIENGYADIPLTTVAALTEGPVSIYVHAKDAAGNWGAASSVALVVDKTKPTLSGINISPNPTNGAMGAALAATAADNLTGIVAAEWFTGADPGLGNGAAMAISGSGPWSLSANIDISTWGSGTYTLYVRARDAAGNWSNSGSTTLTVTHPVFFSTFGNTNPPGVGGTADDADIYSWSGTAYSRVIDATSLGLPTSANIDGFDRIDNTHFYVSFSATTTTVPGLGAVQDEDVVYYNNGVWSVYFDGTAHGLTSNNHDLDAIDIVNGVLYFSTVGAINPPGVSGAADSADIYSWDGVSFQRVFDASAAGLGNANVDGYVRIDATHFYLSFSGGTTILPGIGAVQDEDIVYYANGVWYVYFDGTAHGLGTSANLDIDAFDLP
jgi:FtsP/CotA-like multicopper oxidase with cupredoxin domain